MKTLGEVLKLSTEFLANKGCVRPRRMVEDLLSFLLKAPRLNLYLQFDRPMEEGELERLRGYLKRAATQEPLDYIFGEKEFYGCRLTINSHVLIPRQETEVLLDLVVQQLKQVSLEGKVAWDLCTGSGCLGVALKKTFPELSVTLSDVSFKALAVAAHNAERNEVEVEIVQGDLLEPFRGKQVDFLLCNPPYVALSVYPHLAPSVREFEPKEALVGGEVGLDFYRRLAAELPLFLRSGAKVFLEIGDDQGEQVLNLFSSPHWVQKKVHQDLNGKDRFFFLEFESVVPL